MSVLEPTASNVRISRSRWIPDRRIATLPAMSALETIIGSMSLAELARLANTTVEQIVAAAMSSASPRSSARSNGRSVARPPSRPAAAPKPGALPRGGVRLDQLLRAVAGAKAPIDINSIRAKVGGSAAQVRAGLKKLESAGQVRITGERKGTRYAAA